MGTEVILDNGLVFTDGRPLTYWAGQPYGRPFVLRVGCGSTFYFSARQVVDLGRLTPEQVMRESVIFVSGLRVVWVNEGLRIGIFDSNGFGPTLSFRDFGSLVAWIEKNQAGQALLERIRHLAELAAV